MATAGPSEVPLGVEPRPAASRSQAAEPQTRLARASRSSVLVGAVVVVLALASGGASFLVLTGLTPIVPTHNVVVTALGINGVLVVLLLAMIAWEVGRLLVARRRGIAGARLHGRIVGLFALVAAIPAILVAVIASVTLDRGLDRWFSTRNQQIIENSVTVAEAYVAEHARVLRADLLATANDLNRVIGSIETEKTRFDEFVRTQVLLRNLNGAYVIRRDYSIVTRAVPQEGRKYLVPPEDAVSRAENGEVVVILPGDADQISALVKLLSEDLFLYVVREVDPTVMQHLRATREAVSEYANLAARRFGVQLAFGLMYVGVALILLLSAVWMGLWFANRLVAPIRRLIGAAKLVSEGNLDVRVPVKISEGDLANLGATFNDMTGQLHDQRNELLQANAQLDHRRRFTEAVLAGVTAGVIGLDHAGRVTLANRSAETLLGRSAAELNGNKLGEVVPELAEILEAAAGRGSREHQGQVALRRDTEERIVTVRVTSEGPSVDERGYVVTLDDISELVTAQRTSAWADVARRIAHEIKNPLTPIQLSAERLRRKYDKVITDDRQVFEQCTDTIIRQVGDIGRMVDEFSSFARMPKAVLDWSDLTDVVRQTIFLMQSGNPGLEIVGTLPGDPVMALFDRRLMSQVLTNLIKNASEAIAAVDLEEGEKGRIDVTLSVADGWITLEVTDNGCGLPETQRQRLLEPYVTTREKGTGLGLAIVRRVMEEHGGTVALQDAPAAARGGRGASIVLRFPKGAGDTDRQQDEPATPKAAE